MGQFRVTVVAVGNHGCQREQKNGDEVTGCGQPSCTDCVTREYVTKLKAIGSSVTEASIQHWPGQSPEILDNLLTKKRAGSF